MLLKYEGKRLTRLWIADIVKVANKHHAGFLWNIGGSLSCMESEKTKVYQAVA